MSIFTKTGCRLLAMLLCTAILLSGLTGLVGATATETNQTEETVSSSNAAVFDVSALDGLAYTDGTVSAWLEYDCGNGIMTSGTNKSYLQVSVDTDYAHFLDYCLKMSQNTNYANVYTAHEYGHVGSSSDPVTYARYKAVDGSHTVYVYILNALNEVRIIVDTNADMTGVYANGFVYESTTGETAQPMMVMYGLSMAENGYHIETTSTQYCTDKVNSGALIVIRMPDNSLFINDGGSVEQWNDDACDRFMAFLREMTGKSEGEKVVINTWFLSHAHTDHFQGFTRFVDHYYDQIDIKSVMYNIDSERLGTARDLTNVLKLFRAYFPAVKYYKPHTGESFNIAGIDFDVVYTHEDRFYPTANGQQLLIDHLDGKSEYAAHGSQNGSYRDECFKETVYSYDSENSTLVGTATTFDYSDFNDTSTVLKVTFPAEIIGTSEDMTALLYADVNRVDQTMLKVYDGTDMLKANIMMIPHHGHDAHPELAKVSEADVFLYTQRKSAIYGPNGIVDYGVDIGGTYRPALVYNYMAMQEHIEKSKIYWQGTETVCLTFGDAQNLPSGMTRDTELSATTGIYAYTCDTINFKYEGWTLFTVASGSNESAATNVDITMKRIRFDQVTSLKNEGRYMIVHDQTDNVLMYDAVARKSGQTKPNLGTSMEVGSGQEASNGLVDAYYKVTDSSQPNVETKNKIYCTRDKRDAALWILGQDGVTGSGTALNTATAKFGGTTAYSTTQLYKGTSSDDAYWYSVSGNDYVNSSTGNQWRYLRISGSPVFYKGEVSTNWIEFFEDGTCLIYYYGSSSSVRFLTVTPEGNWVRKVYKQSELTDDVLNSLKLRMYEYKTRSGAKTIAYSGPQNYEVLKDTSTADVINSIASTFRVIDSSVRNRPIPCSGSTAKVGYYWLDGTIKTSSVSTSKVTLKYRNDDGTDSAICTISTNVVDSLYLDTVISGTSLTVIKGQTDTDGKVCEVYHNPDGYSAIETTISLDMLTDANGNHVSSNVRGEYTGLNLTYNGQILATNITLTVADDGTGYQTLFGGNDVSGAETETTARNLRFKLLTASRRPRYGERYLIVHDKTNTIMSYTALAQNDGQTGPNATESIKVYDYAAAKAADSVDAYFSSSTTENGHGEYIYMNHHLRDEALWIVAQTKKESYGTLDIAKGDALSYTSNSSAVKTYLGGDCRYHHTWLYKGNGPDYNADGTVADANNGMYWNSISGNDAEGKQWRYLRLDETDMFGIKKVTTNIESFSDDTFLIYYKDGSNYHVLSMNDDGTWGYQIMTASEVKANLDNLKIRLYKYGNDSGYRTVSYEGMQDCYVPLGTSEKDVLDYILSEIKVTDAGRNACAIPCSGTSAQIAHYWLDTDFDTGTASQGTVTVKYRNDDATDIVIATISIDVK